jgi:putative addiction module killer protein
MYTVQKTNHFEKWLRRLKDVTAKARILARLKKVELGNLGDHKSVGRRVSEMRIDFGPGYRLYFTRLRGTIVILLLGGDKASQRKDIRRAEQIAKEIGG